MELKLSPKRFNMLHLASVSNQIFRPGEEPAGGFRRASSSSGWARIRVVPAGQVDEFIFR
jgi:hypothetical protein